MKKYLKIIGILELVCVAIAILYYITVLPSIIEIMIENPRAIIQYIIGLLLLVFIAPALGLLFISHSNSLPNLAQENSDKHELYITKPQKTKRKILYKIGDIVDCVDEQLISLYNLTESGEIISLRDDDIYVKFNTQKGHYTLRVTSFQIKKSKYPKN